MGNKIAPTFKSGKKNNTMLRESIWTKLNEEYITDDGALSTFADIMAKRLVNTACFAESDKDAISAAKLVLERIEGKAAVADTTTKVEMPAVKFVLGDADLNLIEDNARHPSPPEEQLPDRFVVSIEGVDGEMEFE